MPRRCTQVFCCLDVAAVHLLQRIVDRVNHEWDEVVNHTKQECALAQRKVGKVEQCHGGECSYQDVHPHRQDEEHHDGIGILHLGLREDIRCRIAQQDTEQGVEKGDSDGIHKGIDGFGMRQKFLEIIERDVTVLIGEREEHDEQQG